MPTHQTVNATTALAPRDDDGEDTEMDYYWFPMKVTYVSTEYLGSYSFSTVQSLDHFPKFEFFPAEVT